MMHPHQSPEALERPAVRRRWPMLAPLAVLLFGTGYTIAALGLPLRTALGFGPGFLPFLIGLLIIVSAGWALATRSAAVPPDEAFQLGEEAWRVPLLLTLLAAYLVLLNPVGHLISAALMASASLWVLGRRPWWMAAAIGAGLSIGSWALFDLVLGLTLPSGLLG